MKCVQAVVGGATTMCKVRAGHSTNSETIINDSTTTAESISAKIGVAPRHGAEPRRGRR